MLFSNWGLFWKSLFQPTIPWVGHEEKMIENISLISQSILSNLKGTSPLMMRVAVVHLLKRNAAEML